MQMHVSYILVIKKMGYFEGVPTLTTWIYVYDAFMVK